MSNQQIEVKSMNEIFDDYIKEFNKPPFPNATNYDPNQDSALSAALKKNRDLIYDQLTFNYIETRNQRIKMVAINDVNKAFETVIEPLIKVKKTRTSDVLNTILGDIQTLTADHVMCLAFDYDKYWMVYKEPGDNRYETCFDYHLETVDKPSEEIVNDVHYLMTDANIQDVLNSDFDENFVNEAQKQAILKASVVTVEDFIKWAKLY